MYLLRNEKEEILEALEEKYRSVLKEWYEGNWQPGEDELFRQRINTIKSAMKKILASMK